MKDLFEHIYANKGSIGRWSEHAEGYYVFPKLEGELGPHMKFQGKEILNWSINDYLGLANHPEVRKVDAEAAAEYGAAYPMGARMMSGHTTMHEELEKRLAKFVHKEAAYLLNFGYQGMVSIIDALVTKNDVIVYDVDAHACIIDGVRLHFGKRYTYQHNDMESFEKNLERAAKLAETTGGGILVISEGVFGMRGEQGKLKEIVALKKKYPFRLLVDDAHGFGTLGPRGEGTGVHQGVQDEIDVYFSTFAKSMAGIGAFVAGNAKVVDYLKYNLRSQMFAKSLPMIYVKGALKRLEMMERQQAQMQLYRSVGVSPMGGCLPMLLQMPILVAVFMYLPSAIELRQQSFLWASDLSTFDTVPFLTWNVSIPLIGRHISLFCLLMTITNIKITEPKYCPI